MRTVQPALPIAAHGFSSECREAQKSRLVNLWLSPFSGASRRPVKALTMEKLCDNIVRSKIPIQRALWSRFN
ncbi:hypothetical protein T11_8330 [Trichinella zimbabwensis]|uniref:Uncharacterized protein n=1 Tax=Trichinella zimbabwensis TaxID=268475 RepID=A0A0V1I5Z3_9BILA|nr:hypothetical protein T11_8330 [Trichinella zimbabwensis]